MELCVNHKFTTSPSADDIAQAIDATPHPDDWYLVLDADDGSYVDAAARPDGAGGALAERWCMGCHVIEREPSTAVAGGVPSFAAIAAKRSTTATSLDQYLSVGHTYMPDFSLSASERNALVAYILSLR
jgi:mono/diheme cytochrome c family protein